VTSYGVMYILMFRNMANVDTGTHLQPLTDTPIDPDAHASTKRTPHV